MRLHDSLDTSEVVSAAVEILDRLVQARSWGLFLKAEESDRLDLITAVNALALPVGPIVYIKPTASATADAKGDPVVRSVNESRPVVWSEGPVPARSSRRRSKEAGAMLSVPLIAGGSILGAVVANRKSKLKPGHGPGFTPQEVKTVEIVSRSLASALRNAAAYAKSERQALIDDLTRLYNLRYLHQALEAEIRRARRYGTSVSVVFMDLDGFKQVNDRYGHRTGSLTLAEVARVVTWSVREADLVARYGGDEFVVILPETSARRAVQVAERVRSRIERHVFGGDSLQIALTACFGVACYPEHASETGRLMELADAAMYRAKQSKKNAVRLAEPQAKPLRSR